MTHLSEQSQNLTNKSISDVWISSLRLSSKLYESIFNFSKVVGSNVLKWGASPWLTRYMDLLLAMLKFFILSTPEYMAHNVSLKLLLKWREHPLFAHFQYPNDFYFRRIILREREREREKKRESIFQCLLIPIANFSVGMKASENLDLKIFFLLRARSPCFFSLA